MFFLTVCLFLNILLVYGDVNWTGKWFPINPTKSFNNQPNIVATHNILMGIKTAFCDNAHDNLAIDFNPDNKIVTICLKSKTDFRPNYATVPTITQNIIPTKYNPPHKCMNESINYEQNIPTFGAHRPLWLKYGEYLYAPPQRWLHNVEHGAVVMLYHPCAYYSQVEKLKMLVKNCLFRHVITKYNSLSTERPLALVAWGNSMEMSVVNSELVLKFIKKYALRGPEKTAKEGQYDKLILSPARLVSDVNDSLLCPNISFQM